MERTAAPFVAAVDGRCASGKTTLALRLGKELSAPVIHMDDFYLPFALRTPMRLRRPGGHMDFERLEKEILAPVLRGEEVLYRAYDPHMDAWGTEMKIPPQKFYIVEGTYALLPELKAYYGYKIFLTVNKQTQRARLLEREGEEKLAAFLTRWIPAEEAYFSACQPRSCADAAFDTSL